MPNCSNDHQQGHSLHLRKLRPHATHGAGSSEDWLRRVRWAVIQTFLCTVSRAARAGPGLPIGLFCGFRITGAARRQPPPRPTPPRAALQARPIKRCAGLHPLSPRLSPAHAPSAASISASMPLTACPTHPSAQFPAPPARGAAHNFPCTRLAAFPPPSSARRRAPRGRPQVPDGVAGLVER